MIVSVKFKLFVWSSPWTPRFGWEIIWKDWIIHILEMKLGVYTIYLGGGRIIWSPTRHTKRKDFFGLSLEGGFRKTTALLFHPLCIWTKGGWMYVRRAEWTAAILQFPACVPPLWWKLVFTECAVPLIILQATHVVFFLSGSDFMELQRRVKASQRFV